MKVLIKKPGKGLEVIDVKNIEEINKLVGNVDEKGNGYSFTGSDFRGRIFDGIDMHMNGEAIFNVNLEKNFWDTLGHNLYCGNVIFAGYDSKQNVCELNDEQVEFLRNNIRSKFDIF